jgi:methionyl-tRNA formyltransferase
MRVTVLTQDDPLYILPFFETFLALDLRNIEITSIFACRSMGNRKRTKLIGELVRLFGIQGFFRLAGLQLWQRTASALRLGRMSGNCYALPELAKSRGIPYQRIGNPNSEQHYASIAATAPDVLVSVACPHLLKRKLLDLPARAALNIHHAPLPRYKGMMPTFWQMYHGEESAGITVHTMAEEIDGGQIIFQGSIPVVHGESMHCLIRRSKREGAHAMQRVLQQYAQGADPAPIELAAESSYFTFPTAAEMRTFRQRGLRGI